MAKEIALKSITLPMADGSTQKYVIPEVEIPEVDERVVILNSTIIPGNPEYQINASWRKISELVQIDHKIVYINHDASTRFFRVIDVRYPNPYGYPFIASNYIALYDDISQGAIYAIATNPDAFPTYTGDQIEVGFGRLSNSVPNIIFEKAIDTNASSVTLNHTYKELGALLNSSDHTSLIVLYCALHDNTAGPTIHLMHPFVLERCTGTTDSNMCIACFRDMLSDRTITFGGTSAVYNTSRPTKGSPIIDT